MYHWLLLFLVSVISPTNQKPYFTPTGIWFKAASSLSFQVLHLKVGWGFRGWVGFLLWLWLQLCGLMTSLYCLDLGFLICKVRGWTRWFLSLFSFLILSISLVWSFKITKSHALLLLSLEPHKMLFAEEVSCLPVSW